MRRCSAMSASKRLRCSAGSVNSWKALASSTPQAIELEAFGDARVVAGSTRASAASLAG